MTTGIQTSSRPHRDGLKSKDSISRTLSVRVVRKVREVREVLFGRFVGVRQVRQGGSRFTHAIERSHNRHRALKELSNHPPEPDEPNAPDEQNLPNPTNLKNPTNPAFYFSCVAMNVVGLPSVKGR
jgi:hypothetical protein